MELGLIYKYTSKTTNKSYIGKTLHSNYTRRHNKHKYEKDDSHFGRAKTKYGYEDFELSIVEDNIPADKLDEREIFWIAEYDSFNNGYNSTKGGEGGNTYSKRTKEQMEETKRKISLANKGKNNGIAKNPHLVQGERNGMYGKRPHNALYVILENVETGEKKQFDKAVKVANFLGRKSCSFYTKMKKNNLIVNGWRILKEGVETTENIT